MPHLRLVRDEPETEPPAPFVIRDWRQAAPVGTLDVIAEVEQAFGRVQRSIDSLNEQLDEADPFPFPGRINTDDDGPWAA